MPCVVCGKTGRNLCDECNGQLSPLSYARVYPGDSLYERFDAVFGKDGKISLESLSDYNRYLEILQIPTMPIKPSIYLTSGDIKILNICIEKIKKEIPTVDAISGVDFLLRLATIYCLHEKKGNAAVILAKIVLKFEPQNISANLVSGFGSLLEGHTAEASSFFDIVLEKQPQNAIAWYGKALVMRDAGRWGAAVQFLNEAIKRDENFYLAYVEKAKILLSQGRLDEADRIADNAIRIMPEEGCAWALKAEVLNASGKWGGAYQCLNQAISLEPLNTDYLIQKVELLLAHNRKEEARELLVEIMQYQKSEELEKLLKECG